MKKLLILCLFLCFTSVAQAQTAEPTAEPTAYPPATLRMFRNVTLLTDSPKRNEKIELSADIDATFTNPYDPDDIRVDGTFTAPSGAIITVPGFYYRDFSYDSGSGSLTPSDNWSWRVRFTPTETGMYHYTVRVMAGQCHEIPATPDPNSMLSIGYSQCPPSRSIGGTFTVADSDNPGFIHLDPRNPRYFAFDNGKPYFPIGEDMGWSDSPDPLADYAKWLGKLSDAGGNFVRVWMPPWGFDIEWLDTGLGNYDKRQGQAYQLDRVMDMLDADHVYMMLSLLNHGQFSTTTNPEWDQNPFNAVNGGPCADPQCFATDPTAIHYWQQKLRYIAARWGYSTQIFAFEWWNEINWTPLQTSAILAPWLKQSGDLLRSLDPYHHLITHEGNPVNDKAVWTTDSIDFTQDHRYNMSNLLLSFHQDVPQWLNAYPSKPFLIGEFGDPLAIDNIGLFLHLGLWSAPMNGSGGSGMSWYWDDYVDRLDLYPQFAGIAAFFKDEDMGAHQWQPTSAKFTARGGHASIYGVQASDEALLWVVNGVYNNASLSQQYNDSLREAILNKNKAAPAYSFEGDAQGWALDASGAAGTGIRVSSDQATDGKSSLAVNAVSNGSVWQEAIVAVQPSSGSDWSAHTSVSMDIYAPANATDFSAQLYVKTPSGESDSQHFALTVGQWNHLTLDLSPVTDRTQIAALGVKIGTNIDAFKGTFYVDKVTFSDTPDVKFAFDPVPGMTLAVTGMTPGSYTVELWDTQSGTIRSRTPVTSSDGTVNVPLPSFTSDVAIKVKAG